VSLAHACACRRAHAEVLTLNRFAAQLHPLTSAKSKHVGLVRLRLNTLFRAVHTWCKSLRTFRASTSHVGFQHPPSGLW